MLHLSAYSAVVGPATSLTALAPVADTVLRTVSNDLYVPQLNKIAAVASVGANITGAQLQSPSLARRLYLDLTPIVRAANMSFTNQPLYFYDDPVTLDRGEALDYYQTNDVGTTGRVTGLVWFADDTPKPVHGEILTVKATGTTTLTAGAWTAVPLTFSQRLPVGNYDIVGMAAASAGALAARLVVPGLAWRPGVPGQLTITERGYPQFRNGECGVLASFYSDLPPQIEFLSASADTAETVYLDVVFRGQLNQPQQLQRGYSYGS